MFFAFVCLIGFPENPSHFQARLKLPGLIGFSKIFLDSVKYRYVSKWGALFDHPKIYTLKRRTWHLNLKHTHFENHIIPAISDIYPPQELGL
jgi:hypothetical protein